jgi:hypothetical protein
VVVEANGVEVKYHMMAMVKLRWEVGSEEERRRCPGSTRNGDIRHVRPSLSTLYKEVKKAQFGVNWKLAFL